MFTLRRIFSILAVMLAAGLPVSAQSFDDFIQAGRDSLEQNNFEEAIKIFQGAVRNARTSRQTDMAWGWLEQAYQANRDTLEQRTMAAQAAEKKARGQEEIAVAAAKEAQLQYRRSEANRLAYIAGQLLSEEPGEEEKETALLLSFLARQVVEGAPPGSQSSAVQAFGNAVRENFTRNIQLSGPDAGVLAFSLSKDGKIVIATAGKRLYWAYLDREQEKLNLLSPFEEYIVDAAFSKDGKKIVLITKDGKVGYWREKEGWRELYGHEGRGMFARLSPDGQKILSGSGGGDVVIWNLNTRQRTNLHHEGAPSSGQFSPDGAAILTRASEKEAKLWSAEGELLNELNLHKALIYHCAFSPGGRRILTASADGTAVLWDERGNKVATLNKDAFPVFEAQFIPADTGNLILTIAADGVARFWDYAGVEQTRMRLSPANGLIADVKGARPSPQGERILFWSVDTAQVVDLAGNMKTGLAPDGYIRSGRFSNDGSMCLLYGEEATLWDAKGMALLRQNQHEDILAATFSFDDKYLITLAQDKSLKIVRTPPKVYREHPLTIDSEVAEKYKLEEALRYLGMEVKKQ
ncbi:MAG: WD40 repeat domain-containing protein [Lewinellaceae bacterium]|nr:WD40 repeat domain-containing protein [Lewinellaceae bacterium]